MPSDDVSAQLIAAIHEQRVSSLPDTAAFVEAKTACVRIGTEIAEELERLVEELSTLGIEATPEPDHRRPRQFHAGSLTIDRRHLGTAVRVLSERGLTPPFEPTEGRLAAVAAVRPSLRFHRFDGHTTRLTVVFGEPAPRRLPSIVRPTALDIASRDAPLWRLVADRVARSVGQRLGATQPPLAENDFLGTPQSLLRPLLTAAGVGPDDVVMDLGCGDGRVVIDAAQTFGCRAIGVEVVEELAARARANVEAAALDDVVEIREGPVQTAALGDGTVLFAFLPSHLVGGVVERCLRAGRPGARIVVHEQLPLQPNLSPDRSLPIVADDALTVAHLWTVPG